MSTRVHVGARVGRHVASEVERWRAHGYSGPWLGIRGGNALALNRPPYLTLLFPLLSSLWDYVPTRLSFAGDVVKRHALDAIRTTKIVWTRVHAIIK